MLKAKKISAFVLAAVMVFSLFTFGAMAADTQQASRPTVLPNGMALDVKSAIHFEDEEYAMFINDPSGTYDTMAATYGLTEEGAFEGNAFEMTTAGSAGSAQAIIIYGPEQSVNIEGSDGVMFYVDMSGLHSSSSNGEVGVSLALFPSTTPDGMYNMYLPTQGGGFTYSLNSSSGYYYDAEKDAWVETTNSLSGLCMTVPAKYKGWIYIPYESYFLNGTTTGKKNNMVNKGISNGEFYMRAISVYTTGYSDTEAGTRVLIDEVSFVGAGNPHQHEYGAAETVDATCAAAGTVTKTCSDCGFVNVQQLAKTAHSWGDWMYDSVNNVKVHVCSVCGRAECEDATGADASLPAYSDKDNNTVAVVFDYNNGSKKVYRMAAGDTIDMGEIAYPSTYTEGADKYIFNCWTTDKDGLKPSNPHGAVVNGDVTYYLRWALDTGYFYAPGYKIESSEGGVYNAPLYNKGKVVFYGSSNFRMWTTLITDMGPELPSLNHGISGCNDTHLLANLTRLVLVFEPKIVVINCSTNDLITAMTDDDIKANKEELYNRIHELYPETVIVFTSHMPLPQYKGTANEQRMKKLNVWVEEFCDTHDRCEYLDVFNPVIDLGPEYFADALHFSDIGQELYGKIIKDALLAAVEKYDIDFASEPVETGEGTSDAEEPDDTSDVEEPDVNKPEAPVVVRSNQTITIDGETVKLDVYNINGNNYFKLRDIAMELNGTAATFGVGYDNATRTITCTTGAAYEANGSELIIGEDLSDTAVESNQPLYIDGKLSTIKAFNIGGNNFFQLRELGEALGFGVDYDNATRTVLVTTGTAEESDDTPDVADPAAEDNEDEAAEAVYFTIAVDGELKTAAKPIAVSELTDMTVEEVIKAAHAKYFDGGEAGFVAGTDATWNMYMISTCWGIATTPYVILNGAPLATGENASALTADTAAVKAGDNVIIAINTDYMNPSPIASISAEISGDEAVITVTGWALDFTTFSYQGAPIANHKIVDGNGAALGATDADGKITVKAEGIVCADGIAAIFLG